jgi:orotidine-5'-phosphate decarboxylase
MKAGASALVIGRPIIQAHDPLAALEGILTSLRS